MARKASKVKEQVASWSQVRQLLRSGDPEDRGSLVPVVIPKDNRGFTPLLLLALGIYAIIIGGISTLGGNFFAPIFFIVGLALIVVAMIRLIRTTIVEIEEGTTGILSSWGEFTKELQPGRQYIWKPWQKVEYIVDTTTEIPYSAPVASSPTIDNVPLKSIEFFLKFLITDPVSFVRHIGASNFDIVLSSAVQDAIRQRSRIIKTEDAYSLRGSNVTDMQEALNVMLERYGVRITGANIPDVQLPDQYQNDLATKERTAKELDAYEREWDLTRKRRKDALELEIEQAKKEREARLIEIDHAKNLARQQVAIMLQEKEASAEKIRLDIEATGRAGLKAAENQAKALQRLGESYQDNWPLLRYELEIDRLSVAEKLMSEAPRPFIVKTAGGEGGGNDIISTLVLAQLLPEMIGSKKAQNDASLRNRLDGVMTELGMGNNTG